MKHLLLPFMALSTVAFGQITLTDQHFAGPSESYIFSTLTDPTIDYATTGANYTWDFSSMVPQDQRSLITRPSSQITGLSIIQFGSFAPAPYKATYFNSSTDLPLDQASAFLPIPIDELNGFTKNSSNAITSIGYELVSNGQGLGFRSDTIETRYALPMTYGNNYESRGYTNLDLNPIYDAKWRQHRHRITNVDGWGIVKTPFGQFDALRIHHVIDEFDSIYFSVQGLGMWIPIPVPLAHEYEWRSTSDKEAVMRIRTNEILGTETVTAIEYRDNFNGLGLIESQLNVSFYPNPVINELHVSTEKQADNFFIVDQSGRIWKKIPGSSKDQVIDVSELASGSYSLVVLSSDGYTSVKFIK
ncbi:T9SS type A sorting domain-containing protein [Fluviicola chungangensis]|uniref:T9SS type A sorting domain-containing protein n=1 Tax=Fluviicola chungangensis TaxID=2597671 RepID=A0A556MNX3_9FLAO|nr:T9SS type A sorting domain-containing protein [Fluviicola chungangensis]TSJ41633.1 T9SS type A sorting domain-containing protein [Fluviicola chungangensis]